MHQTKTLPAARTQSASTVEHVAAEQLAAVAPTDTLRKQWTEIRRLAKKNPVVPIASVGADGHPHITPIGSLWLHRTEPRGLYLELFTKQLPKNLGHDPRFTMLFVDSGAWTWLRALVRGTFKAPVGVRLHGVAGPPRATEPHEAERFKRLVKPVAWTKGHDLLWSSLPRVRDLTFTGATPIRLGAMTKAPELRVEALILEPRSVEHA